MIRFPFLLAILFVLGTSCAAGLKVTGLELKNLECRDATADRQDCTATFSLYNEAQATPESSSCDAVPVGATRDTGHRFLRYPWSEIKVHTITGGGRVGQGILDNGDYLYTTLGDGQSRWWFYRIDRVTWKTSKTVEYRNFNLPLWGGRTNWHTHVSQAAYWPAKDRMLVPLMDTNPANTFVKSGSGPWRNTALLVVHPVTGAVEGWYDMTSLTNYLDAITIVGSDLWLSNNANFYRVPLLDSGPNLAGVWRYDLGAPWGFMQGMSAYNGWLYGFTVTPGESTPGAKPYNGLLMYRISDLRPYRVNPPAMFFNYNYPAHAPDQEGGSVVFGAGNRILTTSVQPYTVWELKLEGVC